MPRLGRTPGCVVSECVALSSKVGATRHASDRGRIVDMRRSRSRSHGNRTNLPNAPPGASPAPYENGWSVPPETRNPSYAHNLPPSPFTVPYTFRHERPAVPRAPCQHLRNSLNARPAATGREWNSVAARLYAVGPAPGSGCGEGPHGQHERRPSTACAEGGLRARAYSRVCCRSHRDFWGTLWLISRPSTISVVVLRLQNAGFEEPCLSVLLLHGLG